LPTTTTTTPTPTSGLYDTIFTDITREIDISVNI
jgi:hypothetical protein